ncbi:Hypothetical predicted protein [Pelobates cultripes]|uniref:Uncharacterized protein n=1 Tax=Pelobates cultripes TaxID=61616 RepID=A0AAD1T254_PELCU|nr:Hypothetical predicted protein [Pelobates cultripes]
MVSTVHWPPLEGAEPHAHCTLTDLEHSLLFLSSSRRTATIQTIVTPGSLPLTSRYVGPVSPTQRAEEAVRDCHSVEFWRSKNLSCGTLTHIISSMPALVGETQRLCDLEEESWIPPHPCFLYFYDGNSEKASCCCCRIKNGGVTGPVNNAVRMALCADRVHGVLENFKDWSLASRIGTSTVDGFVKTDLLKDITNSKEEGKFGLKAGNRMRLSANDISLTAKVKLPGVDGGWEGCEEAELSDAGGPTSELPF